MADDDLDFLTFLPPAPGCWTYPGLCPNNKLTVYSCPSLFISAEINTKTKAAQKRVYFSLHLQIQHLEKSQGRNSSKSNRGTLLTGSISLSSARLSFLCSPVPPTPGTVVLTRPQRTKTNTQTNNKTPYPNQSTNLTNKKITSALLHLLLIFYAEL